MQPMDNSAIPIQDDEHREKLAALHRQSLEGAEAAGRISKEKHQELLLGGPPVYTEGEILEIKGYRWRVARIDTKKMILRPVRT